MSLFPAQAPLAERVRPRRLANYIGQQHLLGPNGPLRALLNGGALPSLVLWGPPGVGKTTLALLLAQELNRPFVRLSAVDAGVREVREVLQRAATQPGTLLFIDEIHRFNKAQQDALLHAVERGTVTLVGATTENPSFEVIRPLLSRCQVYVLEPLSAPELESLLHNALQQDELLKTRSVELAETQALHQLSGGDARKALNLLELVLMQHPEDPYRLQNAHVIEAAQRQVAPYDKDGEQHYDTISAFIKSIRGGDPNAGLYWLARMVQAGEDLRFIGRRLLILASEDVGNANPNALLLAQASFEAVQVVGLPEAGIILAQCVSYLATSPKSNASYLAWRAALQAAEASSHLPVPLPLRNAPTTLSQQLGHGQGYRYTHNFADEREGRQRFLPDGLTDASFYHPKNRGSEVKIREYMQRIWGDVYPQNAEADPAADA